MWELSIIQYCKALFLESTHYQNIDFAVSSSGMGNVNITDYSIYDYNNITLFSSNDEIKY